MGAVKNFIRIISDYINNLPQPSSISKEVRGDWLLNRIRHLLKPEATYKSKTEQGKYVVLLQYLTC